jgi:periplasmic divalent cation tolerance protein
MGSPPAGEVLVVTTTLPSEAEAAAVAEAAVGARLAACAQVQGPIRSTFRWQGQIDHATEWYCHLKTVRDRLPALEQLIRRQHPYDVPEIIAVPVVWGGEDYLAWVKREGE